MRERERERQTDRQTDRQTEKLVTDSLRASQPQTCTAGGKVGHGSKDSHQTSQTTRHNTV